MLVMLHRQVPWHTDITGPSTVACDVRNAMMLVGMQISPLRRFLTTLLKSNSDIRIG